MTYVQPPSALHIRRYCSFGLSREQVENTSSFETLKSCYTPSSCNVSGLGPPVAQSSSATV